MLDKRLWFLCAVALAATFSRCNADGHLEGEGKGDEDKMDVPDLVLTGMIEMDGKKVKVAFKQAISEDGKLGEVMAMIEAEGISKPEIIIGAITECTEVALAALPEKLNLTNFVVDMMAAKDMTSRRKRDADGMEDDDSDEKKWLELGDAFQWGIKTGGLEELATGKSLIVRTADSMTCTELEIEKSDTTTVIPFRWSSVTTMPFDKLRKFISEEAGIPKNAIVMASKIMNATGLDGATCKEVKIAFVKKLDRKLLQKLYDTLTSQTCLGFFSATDKCMTKVLESAIGKLIAKSFMEMDDECKKAEYPITDKDSCSNSMLVEKYKTLYAGWVKSMKAYMKKYNIEIPGLELGDDMPQVDWRGYDRDGNGGGRGGRGGGRGGQDRERGDRAGSDADTEAQNFDRIGRFLCSPEPEDLKAAQEKALELLNKGKETESKMLLKEIKEKAEEQEKLYRKAYYGACIMAHSKNKREELLKLREKMCESDDWKETADEEIGNTIRSNIEAILEFSTAQVKMARVKSMSPMRSQTIRKKLLLILGADEVNACTEQGRRRVMAGIRSIPEKLKSIIMKLGSTKYMRMLEDRVDDEEEKMKLTKKLVLFLYDPDAEFEDDILSGVFNMTVDDIMELAPNFTKLLKSSSTEELMLFHIMLLTEEELEAGCPLGELVMIVRESDRGGSRGSMMGDRAGGFMGNNGGSYGGMRDNRGGGRDMRDRNGMQFGPGSRDGFNMPPARWIMQQFGGMLSQYTGGQSSYGIGYRDQQGSYGYRMGGRDQSGGYRGQQGSYGYGMGGRDQPGGYRDQQGSYGYGRDDWPQRGNGGYTGYYDGCDDEQGGYGGSNY